MKQSNKSRSARIVLMLCVLLTMLAPPSFGTSARAGYVTSNWMIPFQGSVTVGTGDQSEVVDLSGSIHLVVKVFAPTDPCSSCAPVDPCRINTNLIQVNGVGQTTGASYMATGAAKFVFDLGAPNSFSFQGSYRLTPNPPPIIEGAPIPPPILPVSYFVTLNSAGEVTEATASVGSNPTGDSE